MKKRKTYNPGRYKVAVKRSSAGLGLFTKEDIPKGECIIEYVGRTLSHAEEYTINSQYLFEIHSRKTIDGSARSNIARYINHSCRPNAETEIYKGRVYVFSRKLIKAGEEISYDYGKEFWNEYIKPYGCRCVRCTDIPSTQATRQRNRTA
jgi:SET domain-containing protein